MLKVRTGTHNLGTQTELYENIHTVYIIVDSMARSTPKQLPNNLSDLRSLSIKNVLFHYIQLHRNPHLGLKLLGTTKNRTPIDIYLLASLDVNLSGRD